MELRTYRANNKIKTEEALESDTVYSTEWSKHVERAHFTYLLKVRSTG
jgi:hypothetical protein